MLQWHHSVKTVSLREDNGLLSLKAEPGTEALHDDKWLISNAKSKSKIILCLGDSAIAKTRKLVDGNKTVLALWDELERIYKMSYTQAAANLQAKFESLSFKDNDEWDKHFSNFLSRWKNLPCRIRN